MNVTGLLLLASDYKLSGMYQKGFPFLWKCVNATDRLLMIQSPSLYKHLQEKGLQPYLYLHEWFLSLFVDCIGADTVLDILDAVMQEGVSIIIAVAVAIL